MKGLFWKHRLKGESSNHKTINRDRHLSPLDFGLRQFSNISDEERLRRYRRFLCEIGAVDKGKDAVLDTAVVQKERNKDYRITRLDGFACRTRQSTAVICPSKTTCPESPLQLGSKFKPFTF